MDHPVSEHLKTLRSVIAKIEQRKSGVTDPLMLHALDAMLKNAQLAIAHYELALRTERELLEEQERLEGISGRARVS